MAQAGWVDLIAQTPHGFKRVQVKTTAGEGKAIRVRSLGSDEGQEPHDRYDQLAVVNLNRLWVIPATMLVGRDTITLKPDDPYCDYAGYRKR